MNCFLLNNDIFLSNSVASCLSYSLLIEYKSTIADNLSSLSKIVICFSSGIYFLVISNVLKKYSLTCFEYLVLILFAIIGHLLLCSADDLLTAYVAIELFSLSSYAIAASKKQSTHSIKGGLKYFITGSVSSAFFLLGSSFLYGRLGVIDLSSMGLLYQVDILLDPKLVYNWTWGLRSYHDWCVSLADELHAHSSLRALFGIPGYLPLETSYSYADPVTANLLQEIRPVVPDNILTRVLPDFYFQSFHFLSSTDLGVALQSILVDPSRYQPGSPENLVNFALVLIVFSLIIKLGLAPFHGWSIDVYEGSPTPSTFFFAVISKLSIYVFLFKLVIIVFGSTIQLDHLILLIALTSIFIGSFGGLYIRKIKTLLAYSSISQMGYLLLGLNSCYYVLLGLEILLFYLFIYMISGLAIWSILMSLELKTKVKKNKHNIEL